MGIIQRLFWLGFAILGAVAYGFMTRLLAPRETVNALWLVIAAACTFVLAYRFYGCFLVTKVLVLNDQNPTPAFRFRDGRDYHPTNKWILFGHGNG